MIKIQSLVIKINSSYYINNNYKIIVVIKLRVVAIIIKLQVFPIIADFKKMQSILMYVHTYIHKILSYLVLLTPKGNALSL